MSNNMLIGNEQELDKSKTETGREIQWPLPLCPQRYFQDVKRRTCYYIWRFHRQCSKTKIDFVFRLKSSHFYSKNIFFVILPNLAWKHIPCIAWKMMNSKYNKCEFCFQVGSMLRGRTTWDWKYLQRISNKFNQLIFFNPNNSWFTPKIFVVLKNSAISKRNPKSRSRNQRVRFKTSVISSRDWHFSFKISCLLLNLGIWCKPFIYVCICVFHKIWETEMDRFQKFYTWVLLCSAMAGQTPVVPARFPSVNYTS